MNTRMLPLLPALLLAVPALAQFHDPEFDVPWVGYDVAVYPNGLETWASATGDVNGDGALDLVATSWHANPRLSVLLGDGRGGFLPPTMTAIPLGSLDLELLDHDGDGDLDVLLTDTGQFWEGVSFSLYRNDGFGRFTLAGSFACGQGPSHLATADFDGDGVLDVAVAHDRYISYGNSIAIVRGRAAGGYEPPVILQLQSGTYDIEAGDWDGDGDADLVVGHETNKVSLLRNNGAGFDAAVVLASIQPFSVFLYPDVVLEDLDRDGDRDVLFAGYGLSTLHQGVFHGAVVLYRNQGEAGFSAAQAVPTSPGTGGAVGVTVTDLTGDGWMDLLTADFYDGWSLVVGDGAGGFVPGVQRRAGQGPFSVRVGSLDGDADLDVVVVARESMEACVYLDAGSGLAADPTPIDLVPSTKAPVSHSDLAASDLDGDGDLDLVVGYSANFITETGISVRLNQGDGTFGPATLYPTPLFPETLILADLDGNGRDDVAWVETQFGLGTPRLRFKRNLGNGSFGTTTTLNGSYCGDGAGLAALDVDSDGDLDLVLADCLEEVYVHLNQGGGNFAGRLVHVVGTGPDAVAGGDLDGDGFLDLVTNTGIQGYVEVSMGNGDGTFQPPFTEASGRGTSAFQLADLDEDGVLDIAAAYQLDGDGATVLPGRGDGTFSPAANYHGTYCGVSDDVLATDVDGDGHLDLLTANHTSQDVSYWRNAGNGQFERLRRYGVSLPAQSLAHGDFDGDGVKDLAVLVEPDSPSTSWYYPAVILLRGRTPDFEDLGLALAGTHGEPRLTGSGQLFPGAPFSLDLAGAREQAPCFHVIGSLRIDHPLRGGTLVPLPEFVVPDQTDAMGRASFGLAWPLGLPAGTSFYAQTWIVDPGAVAGVAASNGLRATQRQGP